MIASRRATATVALQQTPTMVMNMRKLVAKSSMLSTIRRMSMNWVSIRKYRDIIVTKVNTLYNTLAPVDDHSMGRHIPPAVYIRKFRGSIRISGIRKRLIETSHKDTSTFRRVSTRISQTPRAYQLISRELCIYAEFSGNCSYRFSYFIQRNSFSSLMISTRACSRIQYQTRSFNHSFLFIQHKIACDPLIRVND